MLKCPGVDVERTREGILREHPPNSAPPGRNKLTIVVLAIASVWIGSAISPNGDIVTVLLYSAPVMAVMIGVMVLVRYRRRSKKR